jgi:AraC family transcriptional activator of pobA
VVIHERVKVEAKRLLLYTMLNVAEAAATLGYDHSAHSSRMFRQATGFAPAEWRRVIAPVAATGSKTLDGSVGAES